MIMNKLKNTFCYLAGNLESTADAEDWREDFTKELTQLGIKTLNPTRPMFHEQYHESEEMRKNFKEMRKNGQWKELHDIMQQIIRRDLRAVDLSTFLIVKLEPTKTTWGTTHEIVKASEQRKPILFLIEDKSLMPLWLVGLVNMDWVFETKEDLFETVRLLDNGETPMDTKYWKILLPI